MAVLLRSAIALLIIAVLVCPAPAASFPQTGPSCTGARAALPAPELLSPANDSWVTDPPVVLCWTYSYNGLPPDEVSFFLQIDNNQDFSSPEVDTGVGQDMKFTPISVLSADGSYFWRVGAKYNSTESPWSAVWKFNLDSHGPEFHPFTLKRYTSDRNVTVKTCVVADQGSYVDGMRYSYDNVNWTGWLPYVENFTLLLPPVDMKYTIYLQVKDRFNHTSVVRYSRTTLDTVRPVGEISINNGSTYTKTARVMLGLLANDTNGISNMTISDDPEFPDAMWVAYCTTLEWVLPDEEGWHTVYAKFRDPAGLESLTASAAIYLDDIPPSATLTINNGARYTNNRNVSLSIAAVENAGVDAMDICQSPAGAGGKWTPFNDSSTFELPDGDGPKSVYVILRDDAGNIGDPAGASIILDTTPPVTMLTLAEPLSANRSFTVSWSAADTTSGVHSYDVEYREGTGNWTAWLQDTVLERSRFNGTDGAAYSFRARATDNAGNAGPFTDGTGTVRIDVPGPLVEIRWPAPGAALSGLFTISGSASARAHGAAILTVQVRVDNGTWQAAFGTSSWDFQLDSSKLPAGIHNLTARSFDGTKYSSETTRLFYIERASGGTKAGATAPYAYIAAGLLAVLVAMVVILLYRRKQ